MKYLSNICIKLLNTTLKNKKDDKKIEFEDFYVGWVKNRGHVSLDFSTYDNKVFPKYLINNEFYSEDLYKYIIKKISE